MELISVELISLMGFNTKPGQHSQAHCDFDGSRVHACLAVTCHLHFQHIDQGLLHATADTEISRKANAQVTNIEVQNYKNHASYVF